MKTYFWCQTGELINLLSCLTVLSDRRLVLFYPYFICSYCLQYLLSISCRHNQMNITGSL